MSADLAPIRRRLLALENPDLTPEQQRAHILALADELPLIEAEVLSGDAANDAYEAAMAAEFIRGLASLGPPLEAEAANAGFDPNQPRLHGKWTASGGGGGGGGGSKQKGTIQEVLSASLVGNGAEFVDYQDIDATAAAEIAARTRDSRDLSGYKRVLDAHEVRHAMKRHAKDHRPITDADFLNLPRLLSRPLSQVWTSRPGKPDVLVSIVNDGGMITIIEEQRTGRKKLAFLSMYRP